MYFLRGGGKITPVNLPSPLGVQMAPGNDRSEVVLCTDSVLSIWPGADKAPIF